MKKLGKNQHAITEIVDKITDKITQRWEILRLVFQCRHRQWQTFCCINKVNHSGYPAGKDTLISAGLFLESEGMEDQLSPRNEGDERWDLWSAVEMGMAAAGMTVDKESCFCFFGFCSCWFPARKLPTTTWSIKKEKKNQNRSQDFGDDYLYFWKRCPLDYTQRLGKKRRTNVNFEKPNLHRTCSNQQTSNSSTYNTSIWTCQGDTHPTRSAPGSSSFSRHKWTR